MEHVESRFELLNKLRRQIIEPTGLPEVIQGDWVRYDDPSSQFCKTLESVGGACWQLGNIHELPDKLAQHAEWKAAKRIYSAIPSVAGNVDLAQTSDAHDLENLDFVIYPGEFAVAENGAIWLTDRDLRHRVVFFITQFLVLVVDRANIVHTMHEAYARAEVPQPGFGLFLSGPSKTADIEQSLVIGAHGCRELQVVLV